MTQQLEVSSKEPLCVAPDNMPAGSIEVIPPSESDMLPALAEDERSAPLVQESSERQTASFNVNRIQVGNRIRALNAARLESLMQSISTIGLRSPITVRAIPKMIVDGVEEEEVPLLVTGLHRLEAVKRLGMKSIDCTIELGSELDARLWEIDENLCRAELNELERAEHLQYRKTIYEQINPSSRQGGLPGAPGGGKAKTAKLAGFATDTAKHTGIPERSIRRAVRRANGIDATVRDRIRDKPQIADSGIELDTLAGMSAAEQKRAIDLVEAGEAGTVREAKEHLEESEAEGPPGAGPLRAREAQPEPVFLEPPLPEEAGSQWFPPTAGRQSYPEVDPFANHDPQWISGALKLIPLLAEAIPLTETIPNRDGIIVGAIELIPPLADAVLQGQVIAKQQVIEGLLKYCGYNQYAVRVGQH